MYIAAPTELQNTEKFHFSVKIKRSRRNLKAQQSPVILDLSLRKTRSRKSHDNRVYIVFESTVVKCFSSALNGKAGVSKSSVLKSVFEKPRFRDGLVWTVGLTVEIKLRFCDGLVWTVGLTVEIKLRFQISPA